MAVTRRQFARILSLACLPAAFGRAVAATLPRTPDPATFESGDFIWPKLPGAFTPYSSAPPNDPDADERDWLKQRDAFIQQMQADPAAQSFVRDLSELTYKQFYLRYTRDQDLAAIAPYSSGTFAVGHVGILHLDEAARPWVIEANLREGVVKCSYADWLAARPNYIAWHGRVNDYSRDDRSSLASESLRYVGRPYNFWNFDLADDKSFYCSKLVWLSALRSLGVALDGNMTAKRSFWFSPKQLLYSANITRLHDPGRYAVD